MNIKSVEREALQLPADERARLALELIGSLDELRAEEVEELWLAEAGRRVLQLDAGSVELIPGDVVAAEARALLRQ